MMLVSGFDYSPYLGGPLSSGQALRLAALGLSYACIAIDSSPDTVASVLACQAAGMGLDAYRELRLSSGDVSADIEDALQGFAILAGKSCLVRRLWLTAEDTAGDDAAMAQTLRTALAQLAGFNIGGYSGAWYEAEYPQTVGVFRAAGLPLWWVTSGGYDGIAALPHGYAGKQYAGDILIDGINLDLDVWEV